MKVIVVDDSAVVRERIVSLLRDVAGVELAGEAWDAAGALALVERVAPDVVILDLQMPGTGGLEILGPLKNAPCRPRVIVLTNHAGEQHRRECLALGADHFFDKSSQFALVAQALVAPVVP